MGLVIGGHLNGVIEVCEVLAAGTFGIGGHFRRNERSLERKP